ncbi:Cytochrome c oxidase subunit 6a, mitochondrial [Apostasia shenzhenica]|uniref:Cytochrome c oxidase subunit 6a, mitochondrial n=1 Tax=Apostasia shenzhenica TaxID=1088818 RepID=A0A2I0AFB2_9ASPA|nr:Cytochrome c oxidase subunit 6a, mitochondrial [Apostasia shenzhenica]
MTTAVRSLLRAAAVTCRSPITGPKTPFLLKKRFSSSAIHDDAYETAKWEKITYAGIVTCTIISFYQLSKDHPHHPEPPAYSYLHIRNKEFPWGMFIDLFLLLVLACSFSGD